MGLMATTATTAAAAATTTTTTTTTTTKKKKKTEPTARVDATENTARVDTAVTKPVAKATSSSGTRDAALFNQVPCWWSHMVQCLTLRNSLYTT